MIILEAEVTGDADASRTGKVHVHCKDDPRIRNVFYTSPYFELYKTGGFFAPPAIGQRILIAFNVSTGEAFYISTVISDGGFAFKDPKHPTVEELQSSVLRTIPMVGDPNRYYEGAAHCTWMFKNNEDNGLEITNRNNKKYVVNRTKLNNVGKRVVLESTPTVDCIEINNGLDDYIRLTANPAQTPTATLPPRTLEIRTQEFQNLKSETGGINLQVIKGRDIVLENNSIVQPEGMSFLDGSLGVPTRAGNIALLAEHRNIRLSAKGTTYGPDFGGIVSIETASSTVDVSRNAVTISTIAGARIEVSVATGKITITTPSNLEVAAQSINMTAVDSLNLKAQRVNITGSLTNIKGSGSLNLQGDQGLYLNPGGIGNAPSAQITPSENVVARSYLEEEYPKSYAFPVGLNLPEV
jgi:hypothetical protein